MKYKWFKVLVLVLLAFLVACSTDGPDDTDGVTGERPLITEADLDAAALLEGANSFITLDALGGDALDYVEAQTGESALARAKRSGLSTSALSPLELDIDTSGYIAYVQQLKADDEIYVIRAHKLQPLGPEMIYEGRRAVESVAISQDGKIITFTAETRDGNFDVFVLDRMGEAFGAGRQLVRLTDTDADESNVSMSLDGSVHAWQGVDSASGLANFSLVTIASNSPSVLTVNAPFGLLEPSLSGDGNQLVLIADLSGDEIIATVPTDLSDDLIGLYSGGDFSAPSLTLTGDQLMFAVEAAGSDFVFLDDGAALYQLLGAPAGSLNHPYITAGGEYFTYSLDGSVRNRAVNVDDPAGADEDVEEPGSAYSNAAAYWAKPGFVLNYFGQTSGKPKFTRPDDGSGLSDAERTNAYHKYTFKAPVTDYYEILSEQDFDGYILLYRGAFDPNNPEKNLIAGNDDFGGGYDADGDPPGTSRILAELQDNERYWVVTTACGDPNAGCGPNEGSFTTHIRRSEPPPPPYELPAPDDSRYNITLRIVNPEDLTQEQIDVLTGAAERWSAIITADLNNIENFSLPANFSFPNTGEVTGTLDDVLIDLAFSDLGGPGGLLGRAGPRLVRASGTPDELLTIYGLMEFDIRDFEPGGFFEDMQQYEDVIVHEMGHVIGIGTLWQLTGNTVGIQDDPPTVPPGLPNPDYDPRFTGAGAVAEYQALTDAAGYDMEDTVPIANTGGPGNFNGHWREITFDNELMTPYAGGAELLSRMTAASLGDLGYTVDRDSAAVDQDYMLPPPRVPAVFIQSAPDATDYVEGQDFIAASDSAKGMASGAVVNVDLNLDDVDDSTSACEAEDFDSLDVSGKVVLVRRGTCAFADKVLNAQAAGASAVIIMNQGNAPDRMGLLDPSLGDATDTIPVIFVTFDIGVDLAETLGLEVVIDTSGEEDPESTLGTAMLAPSFEEDVLQPIGTVTPDGTIILFK